MIDISYNNINYQLNRNVFKFPLKNVKYKQKKLHKKK